MRARQAGARGVGRRWGVGAGEAGLQVEREGGLSWGQRFSVSHGAHRALRGLWQGMGTVAPRRERAGGELLLRETHSLGSLLVQDPGNGLPYLTGSP